MCVYVCVWSHLSSVQFSRSVVSNSLRPHGLQHTRLPCPSPTPGAYTNSCSLSQWCHPIISPSVFPFSSHLQSFPTSGSFPMSQPSTSGVQSIRTLASASVLPVTIQGWFPLGLTGLISLQSKGLSRVFSSTTIQKHQFFGTQPKPVKPKGNQPWIFIRRTDAVTEAPILWPLDAKSSLIGKDPNAGKDWGL